MNTFRAFVMVGMLSCCGAVAAQAAKAPIAKPVRTGAEVTFDAWDKDHNGQLSREEFRAGWERAQQALQTEARLRQHFATVDANKSGALEPAEYASRELVKKAGKDAPMSRFDANKDGKLQFGEYLRLVQALAPENAGAAK